MAQYADLKAAINAAIKQNNNQEITGLVLNNVLNAMVNSLGANYQFAGVATPSTNPGTPDQNVFYLAGQPGIYSNFNNITIEEGLYVFKWNGSAWTGSMVLEGGSGDGAFDVSAKYPTSGADGGNTYTLQGALAVLNANLSASKKKGGMSIKFIQSSDNKYHQYFLTKNEWSTGVLDWKGIDELYEAIEDIEDRILIVDGKVIPKFKKSLYINWVSTDTMWTYSYYAVTASINSTDLIHLNQGDTIELSDYNGVVFSVFYKKDSDGKYYRRAGLTSKFTATDAGDYAICTNYVPSVALTDESFIALVDRFIITQNDNLAKRVESFETDMAEVKENLGQHNVKAEQLEIVGTKNLYNYSTRTVGEYLNSSGQIVEQSGWVMSDYILLKAGSYWVSKYGGGNRGFSYIAYFRTDTNKTFISRPQLSGNTITLSEDRYIRLMGDSTSGKEMLVPGTTAPSKYYPYAMLVKDEYIPVLPVNGENIIDNSIRKEKTNYVKSSPNNLINHMTIENGYVINISGEKSQNIEYSISDKIYIKPSTYTSRNIFRISCYKSDGSYVGKVDIPPSSVIYTFSISSDFDYVICTFSNAPSKLQRQLVEGSTIPDYEQQYLIIDGYRLHDEPDKTPNPIAAIRDWNKVVADTAPLYLLSTEVSGLSSSDKNVASIYAKYDALMALYPNYITKTELGTNGDPNNPVTLYRYDFKTKGQYSTNTKTKMILISGIHPEWAGIYGLYYALQKIASDPNLNDLKSDLHIICVPIVNAYACNGNASRKNHNGVDLARNFEVGWGVDTDPTSETYSGPYALSEVEAQYIDAIQQNNKDAIIFVSCHSFQIQHPAEGVIWNNCSMWGASPTNYTNNISGKVVDKMTNAWNNKYNYSEDSFGWAKVDGLYGSEGQQAMKYGIQGLTFEVCDYFRAESESSYTSFCMSRNTESYINFIRTAAYCFNYRDKIHQIEE